MSSEEKAIARLRQRSDEELQFHNDRLSDEIDALLVEIEGLRRKRRRKMIYLLEIMDELKLRQDPRFEGADGEIVH